MRRRPLKPREESGQAMVEFTLALPILMLVLLGIFSFGLLFYNYIDLTSSARDGARKASISRTDANAAATVKSTIAASTTVVDDAKTTVTMTPAPPWTSGTDVTVKVTYPYSVSVMGVSLWGGPMTAESVVRVE
jgi:Flp pilus assembly protein TadG